MTITKSYRTPGVARAFTVPEAYAGETWAPCPSFPGVYASDEGRVWRDGPSGRCRPTFGYKTHGWRAYLVGPKGPQVQVNHLVLDAFVSPRPFEGAGSVHLNGDNCDNRPANLRWETADETAERKAGFDVLGGWGWS